MALPQRGEGPRSTVSPFRGWSALATVRSACLELCNFRSGAQRAPSTPLCTTLIRVVGMRKASAMASRDAAETVTRCFSWGNDSLLHA